MSEETPHNNLPVPSGHKASVTHFGDFPAAGKDLVIAIGNATGIVLEPWRMKRKARAEVEAQDILRKGKARTTHELAIQSINDKGEQELARRAVNRMLQDEMRKQEN